MDKNQKKHLALVMESLRNMLRECRELKSSGELTHRKMEELWDCETALHGDMRELEETLALSYVLGA